MIAAITTLAVIVFSESLSNAEDFTPFLGISNNVERVYVNTSSNNPKFYTKEYYGADTIIGKSSFKKQIECYCDSVEHKCDSILRITHIGADGKNEKSYQIHIWERLYRFDTSYYVQGMPVINSFTKASDSSSAKISVRYYLYGMYDVSEYYTEGTGLTRTSMSGIEGYYVNKTLILTTGVVLSASPRLIRATQNIKIRRDALGRVGTNNKARNARHISFNTFSNED